MKNIVRTRLSSFFVIAALFVGNQAHALSYSGSGVWHNSNGENGTHSASVSCEDQADGTKKVSKTYTANNQTKTYSFVLKPVDSQFFKIMSGDQVVGGGYCWDFSNQTNNEGSPSMNGKVCHSQIRVGTVEVEETVKFVDNAMMRIGSKYDSTNHSAITWKEKLDLVQGN